MTIKKVKITPKKILSYLADNAVTIMFVIICAFGIPLSGLSASFLFGEILTRLARNSFLVLSLLIPIMAGMGLNFGMTLGAMAGEIGLILVIDWNIIGIPGIILAMIISTPISILLGWICGKILNMAKGREMVTSYIIGFFMNGVYQLIVLYGMGSLIPLASKTLILPRGYGVRNTVNLITVRKVFDDLISVRIFNTNVPVFTFIIIIALCIFIIWFKKTKLGQDMRAVGQDLEVSKSAGIKEERTRIIAIIISTVFAGIGMIIYLQNMGTLNTYNSHTQIGMFSIAALLVGGASVNKAKISNVFLGIILFHIMFIVSPYAGKNLVGQAMIGEYFRVFVSYGVITLSLVLYELKRRRAKSRIGAQLALDQEDEEEIKNETE